MLSRLAGNPPRRRASRIEYDRPRGLAGIDSGVARPARRAWSVTGRRARAAPCRDAAPTGGVMADDVWTALVKGSLAFAHSRAGDLVGDSFKDTGALVTSLGDG